MKYSCAVVAILLSSNFAFAQPNNVESERERIQELRKVEDVLSSKQLSACYEEFFVNDCLRKARTRHHQVLDKLHLQEVLINDLERKQKGVDQLELIKDKSSPQKLEEESARRAASLEAQNERKKRAAEKAADVPQPHAPSSEGAAKNARSEQSLKAGEALKNKLEYETKLKEAQEHRASKEKNNTEKASTQKKPLPLP
jgi:colicin import membrane protein